RIVPGDICLTRWVDYGTKLDTSILELCQKRLGLNEPLLIQFINFMSEIVTLSFGNSMWTGNSMSIELLPRFALSFQLAAMSLIITIVIAIPLGIISAIKQNTWIDYTIRSISIFGVATPSFWLGFLMLLAILNYSQLWFGEPWMPPIIYVSPFDNLWANISQLIWPSLAVGVRYLSITLRMTRSAMLDILAEDYIRTARSKGVPEPTVAKTHALRNAFLPILTLLGAEFAFLMGGLVVTEQVFNLNGLGALLIQAVETADYAIIQGVVMLIAFIFVFINFIIDIIYTLLDPRIRYN
ncbi:MAG: ABC transporter permease, partial [Alphaproteobacteria bacterium]|nr:ABC transporter permease [Alphaproteobacteria bacterium]